MFDLGSRRALILASIFAVAVVVLSISGAGPGALLSFLLFVVGPLIALYFIVKSAVRAGVAAAGKTASAPEFRTAREILDERYARGEIGPEEYERMRSNLETP
ncbi:MAG: SHOCT domain-containing protein [Actinomycetota bacterium]|nr:SHOCT domain-containing protein [Actinomycetota bacterium]